MVTCEMGKGALCAMLLLLAALTCCLTVILTEWLNDGDIEVISSTTVQIFLIIVISAAIFVMLTVFIANMICSATVPPPNHESEDHDKEDNSSDERPLIRHVTKKIRVQVIPHVTNTTRNTFLQGLVNYAPLIVFGFCAILLDVVFEAPSAINCLSILENADWKNMSKEVSKSLQDVRQHYDLVIAYAMVKGACIALQMIFLCKFAKQAVMIGGGMGFIRCAVVIVLLATTSIFTYTFVRETRERSGEGTDHINIDVDILRYLPSDSKIKGCFVGNSTYQEELQGQSQYFYAFEIEFCLASIGLLLSLAKAAPKHTDVERELLDQGDACESQTGYGSISSLGTETSRRTIQPASPSCEIWGLVFGFIFSAALSVVEGLMGNSNSSVKMSYLSSTEFIHYSSMLVAASSAVALTYRYIPSKDIQISTSNILLIFAATGDLIYVFVSLIPAATAFSNARLNKMMDTPSFIHANVTQADILSQSTWNFATNIVDMIQILVQSFLLIVISGHQFRWEAVKGVKMSWVTFFLQFLAISNLITWLNASFLEFSLFQKILWNTVIYSLPEWTGLLQLLFPVSLFYRFHTVHTLLEAYVGYKTRNKATVDQMDSTSPTHSK